MKRLGVFLEINADKFTLNKVKQNKFLEVKTMKRNIGFKLVKGFTLLELIIVIIIIGILASLAIPQYIKLAEKSRSAEGVSLLNIYRSAQIRYSSEHSVYTAAVADLDITTTSGTGGRFFTVTVAAADPIVTATRNATSDPIGAYLLKITVDGTVTCTNGAAGDCAYIGR